MATRREEIVNIAGNLFARKGFATTTVREIADEAGVLSGSLYHHFDSKDAIAEEILTAYYGGMVDRSRVIVKDSDNPADALAELIRVGFRGIAEQPQAVALIQNSAHLLDQKRFAHIREINEELKDIWVKVIRSAVRQGYFKETVDPKVTRRFIRDTMWITVRWWRPEGQYSIDQIAERYLEMIFTGMLTPAKGQATKVGGGAKATRRSTKTAAKGQTAKRQSAKRPARRTRASKA